MPSTSLILLTGASGYIGGRLLPSLEHQGYRLRCLARHPEILKPKVSPLTEVLAGDVLDRPSLDSALRGVDARDCPHGHTWGLIPPRWSRRFTRTRASGKGSIGP
ncbi:MAG: NAD-dependent epimerase/dehydratase family protein [Nitrospira sp.]|nr:MAG: NAD-dependent epimerase/dehydratase family protein [Nitrospira sp.]